MSNVKLQKLLLTIGESQMDLYLGRLNPKQIANEIINKIKIFDVFTYTNFSKWITDKGMSYKQMELSDNSFWTLRLGNERKRYIHIHPGRYSPQTIRVKAITLKTAIALQIRAEGNNRERLDLKSTNEVRTMLLKLPPLKSLSLSSGIGKFLNHFNQDVR